ncbi:MAG: hypothetical protein EAZ32_07675 [Cytophagia bacterium]|nr:MAG: hypothetical protein EAZ38_09095 [Cytophagales bacterium]TAG40109.1 MAG: hypothetical protein EAZ32_07675 [Cytophagia bacterium]TAG62176.1 MAG: hypothetical protein EAZ26_12575 [Runella slithyformis]TAG81749.1 MAG: hypothetical protein EAZ22_06525 [Cytophagales bacterium]
MEKTSKKSNKVVKTTTKKSKTIMDSVNETAKEIQAEVVETANEVMAEVTETSQNLKDSVMTGVKEVVETLDIEENVSKIKATAKNVNKQVAKTATEVMKDVKKTGKKAKTVSAKLAKDAMKNMEINERLNDAKETANKMNLKVKATAVEMVDEAVENTSKFRSNIMKTAQKAIADLNLSERIENAKKAAKNANEVALETADVLVEGAIANGEKWQKITNKAVKGGLQLAEKQQEIVFSTLETVKGQAINSASRLKKLFTNN